MQEEREVDVYLLFKDFLEEYFDNIKKELPLSHRAQQLEAGRAAREAVVHYETLFLKEPFMKAIKKVTEVSE